MANLDISYEFPGLLSLAPELIEAISEYLDLKSVKEFRLTCKSLGEQLTSAVFRAVSIDINRNNYEKGLAKLTVLSKAKHPACTSTRKLFIGSLAPSFDPNYDPTPIFVDGEWKEGPRLEDTPETIFAKLEMEECLYDAIASFTGVQSVRWIPCVMDNESLQKAVYDALKTLPNLRCLYINLSNCKIPIELDVFKSLQEISVLGASDNYQAQIFDSLAKLIAQNSGITSIDLYNNLGGLDDSQHFHQLFKYYPTHAPPLRLRHLGARSWQMRLNEITLPHLKYLTSLKITWPSTAQSNLSEDIWKTLSSSGISLEEIDLDTVIPSFINYLSSYKGLRKLSLSPGLFSDNAALDEMAKRFFAEAYTNHAPSLEELYISPVYECLWCFGSHNMELISKSTKLRAMGLCTISSELAIPTNSNALKLMIDMAVTSMPHIEHIVVYIANFTRAHGDSYHVPRVISELIGCAEAYRAPLSCRRLPTLRITGSRRRYTPSGNRSSPGLSSHGPSSSEVEEPLRYIIPPAQARDTNW